MILFLILLFMMPPHRTWYSSYYVNIQKPHHRIVFLAHKLVSNALKCISNFSLSHLYINFMFVFHADECSKKKSHTCENKPFVCERERERDRKSPKTQFSSQLYLFIIFITKFEDRIFIIKYCLFFLPCQPIHTYSLLNIFVVKLRSKFYPPFACCTHFTILYLLNIAKICYTNFCVCYCCYFSLFLYIYMRGSSRVLTRVLHLTPKNVSHAGIL